MRIYGAWIDDTVSAAVRQSPPEDQSPKTPTLLAQGFCPSFLPSFVYLSLKLTALRNVSFVGVPSQPDEQGSSQRAALVSFPSIPQCPIRPVFRSSLPIAHSNPYAHPIPRPSFTHPFSPYPSSSSSSSSGLLLLLFPPPPFPPPPAPFLFDPPPPPFTPAFFAAAAAASS